MLGEEHAGGTRLGAERIKAMANLNRFDFNLLLALDTLLSERSVTRAADRLCVTQPALSGSLQRLRQHFDDPLLLRVGREMELTPKAFRSERSKVSFSSLKMRLRPKSTALKASSPSSLFATSS